MSKNKSSEQALFSLLEKLLLKLNELSSRLERVERLLRISHNLNGVNYLANFLLLFKGSLHLTFKSLIRAWIILTKLSRADSITETIIYVLSTCREQSISDVYRGVKKLRGKASRRVISGKLKILESSGIVVNTGSSKRPKYVLRDCLEENSH